MSDFTTDFTRQMPMLLRREFWEHRNIFLVLPAAVAAVLIGLALLGALFGDVQVDSEHAMDSHRQQGGVIVISPGDEIEKETRSVRELYLTQLRALESMDAREREEKVGRLLAIPSMFLQLNLWFVVLFYLLGCLYDERKDRSVLFWKSLPVSDGMTIASKLLSGVLLAPAIVIPFVMLVQVAALLIATLFAWGTGSDLWSTLWVPAHLPGAWLRLPLTLAVNALWMLPIFGWVMLVSAWARSIPLVWACAVPFALALAEKIVFGGAWLSRAFAQHLSLPGHDLAVFFTIDMWAGVAVGIAFVALTVYMRGRGDEI